MTHPALIIIDMQLGMSWASSGARNNPNAEKNIERLLARWRRMRAPVVHVRHVSRTPGSPFWPGQPGVDFQTALMPLDTEHAVLKSVPDAFINNTLERWLHAHSITSLVICGVSTNNSVESTARTAGNLGFQTYVVADACFAFAKKDYDGIERSAQEVHAMSLANLHGEYATVLASDAAMQLLHDAQ